MTSDKMVAVHVLVVHAMSDADFREEVAHLAAESLALTGGSGKVIICLDLSNAVTIDVSAHALPSARSQPQTRRRRITMGALAPEREAPRG